MPRLLPRQLAQGDSLSGIMAEIIVLNGEVQTCTQAGSPLSNTLKYILKVIFC